VCGRARVSIYLSLLGEPEPLPCAQAPTDELCCGGGVWRLKWHLKSSVASFRGLTLALYSLDLLITLAHLRTGAYGRASLRLGLT